MFIYKDQQNNLAASLSMIHQSWKCIFFFNHMLNLFSFFNVLCGMYKFIDHTQDYATEFVPIIRYGQQLLRTDFCWVMYFINCLFRYLISLYEKKKKILIIINICYCWKEFHNFCLVYDFSFMFIGYGMTESYKNVFSSQIL